MSKFSVNDYDCIGFDLDMTLARYKLTNYNELIYDALSNYLITEKNYSKEILLRPIDVNFTIRGLIADTENGNLIRISPDGLILQAAHGTKWLTNEDIIKYYPDHHWKSTDFFVKAPAVNSDKKFRLLGDFLNLPIALMFARAVDSIDMVQGPQTNYSVLQDIASGMRSIIFSRNLCTNDLGVFPQLKKNSENIYHKCSQRMLDWLEELKSKGKKLFLMTGADASHAFLTAECTLGKNWKKLFDIIICFSEKPDFFTMERKFKALDGFRETENVAAEDLKQGGVYTYGNWKDLKQFLITISSKRSPKVLYIGDNIIQDVYAPNFYCQMDTVAICEELEAEKRVGFAESDHPDKDFIRSTIWGSFFPTEKINETFWFNLIKKYAKICVPSVEYLAKFPVDHTFDKQF
ncbi:unnamed protein product [Psylliodes chrysocephalus]|uniref:5'-nucleotidase domain-containing protein 1 n=1 Tax=Psylliodes chrysocephalus TaxID=3402493 RepID=A0A9P0CUX8_9CUCU|nr:unnamed protein product [Psylliodes chrysocephala]